MVCLASGVGLQRHATGCGFKDSIGNDGCFSACACWRSNSRQQLMWVCVDSHMYPPSQQDWLQLSCLFHSRLVFFLVIKTCSKSPCNWSISFVSLRNTLKASLSGWGVCMVGNKPDVYTVHTYIKQIDQFTIVMRDSILCLFQKDACSVLCVFF